MKYLKEMDEWATSNRIGNYDQYENENIRNFIQEYNKLVDRYNSEDNVAFYGDFMEDVEWELQKHELYNKESLKLLMKSPLIENKETLEEILRWLDDF